MKRDAWKFILIEPSARIAEAIRRVDAGRMQIALVVDAENRLLGAVTDGDVRRGILKGVPLTDRVERIMNPRPVTTRAGESRARILAAMKEKKIRQMPILDGEGRVVGIETLDELIGAGVKENGVVLMAGGLGTRLAPLTDDCPKPLLEVGRKPVLETILENLTAYGFRRFYISVHYKSEQIESHFGCGGKWGVEIRYLREKEKLGTAGALTLLDEKPALPLIVMNGDVLTKVNFDQLLEFHSEHDSRATMCVREYDFQVPFGVVSIDNSYEIAGIDEKPQQRLLISAGIYVLNPEVLDCLKEAIGRKKYCDMPDYFKAIIAAKHRTAAFPIREYWLDIGGPSDFKKANGEFESEFR